MKSSQTESFLRRHYDKLLALLMAAGLFAVLVLLGLRMGTLQEQSHQFVADVDGMKPMYLKAKPIDVTTYEAARQQIAAPFLLPGAWTNLLFVPETRVWCVDCRRPIPFLATVCPFCHASEPDSPKQDMDADGMPDEWEERYKLNPRDPSDAALDSDNDGFSNLEEYMYGTDPRDPNSTPSLAYKLRLVSIEAEPFTLLFRSLIKQQDGSYKFGINTRARDRTYFVKIGETVEGFKVEKFESKFVDVDRGGARVQVNKSILTLSRGGKLIELVYGEAVPISDYTAHLMFIPDKSTYVVKKGGSFELKNRKYKVLDIDSGAEVVVIEREIDGIRLNIGKSIPRPMAVDPTE